VKRFLILIGFLYLITCVGLFAIQDSLIFKPGVVSEYKVYTMGKEVEIPVDKDLDMNCLWIKRSNSKKVILYFHGNTGNIPRAAHQAKRFSRDDIDVFIPDYRGFGKTEGKPINDRQLLTDADKAYKFLLSKYNEKDIIVLGYSLGTGMASYVCRNRNPGHLILVAPFTSLMDIKDTYLWMFPDFLLKYKLSNKRHLKEVSCQTTIIHGTEDEIISYAHSKEIHDTYPEVNFITKKGTGHRRIIFQISSDLDRILSNQF